MIKIRRMMSKGDKGVLCADEDARITVWVNNILKVQMPLVYDKKLTVDLTDVGLQVLEVLPIRSGSRIAFANINSVEFLGDDKAYAEAQYSLQRNRVIQNSNVTGLGQGKRSN